MKKILAIFKVPETPFHILNFATKIAKKHSALVQGIFLEKSIKEFQSRYPFPNDLSITEGKINEEAVIKENNILTEDNVKLFEDKSNSTGIRYEIEKDVSINQLIEETSDADLIVANTKADFLNELLPKVHCPACLVSENEFPQKLILMYNSGASSKFAIEKFISIFSEWCNLPAFLVSINTAKREEIENEQFIKETVLPCFKDINVKSLHGNVRVELLNFLEEQSVEVMVIMGAFGRSAVSTFFHESLANVLLEKKNISLFIAHN